MTELYPPLEPYHTHQLPVSDLHTLYVEESGNPQGKPVVFLHGGPGGGSQGDYRRYFNPDKWRIIIFDQRGCGRSTPFAELTDNTTWDLVADLEKIRTHLTISSWCVFGGSWGSTLALTYAITHPTSVDALFLRGIFMLRPKELQWFYQEGASKLFPDAWEHYIAPIPQEERHDLISAFYKRLTGDNHEEKVAAAKAWSVWEASTSKLIPSSDLIEDFGDDHFAQAFARIECHYFVNKGFFAQENFLLDNIDKIRQIPTTIVHGRYDVVCPLESAWELHRKFPQATFKIIEDAGHSLSERGIRSYLIEATDAFVS